MIVLILDQNHHWNWSARSPAQKYFKMQKTGNIILLEAVPENRNFMVYSQQAQHGRGGASFCKKETMLGQNIIWHEYWASVRMLNQLLARFTVYCAS